MHQYSTICWLISTNLQSPRRQVRVTCAVFYISIIYTNILIRTVSSLPKPRPVSVPSHQESDRDSIPPRQAPVDPAKPEVHHISGLSRVESETVQEAAEIPQAKVTPGTDAVHAPTTATATQSVTSAIASDLNVSPAPTAESEINNSKFSSPVIVELSPSPSPIVADSCSADEWTEALLDGSAAHSLRVN